MTNTLSLQQEPAPTKVCTANGLQIRNFRLLWIGEGISFQRDQFYISRPRQVLTDL